MLFATFSVAFIAPRGPIHDCAASSVYDCLSYTDCRTCSKGHMPDVTSICIEPDDMAKYQAAGYRCLATAAPTSPRFVTSPETPSLFAIEITDNLHAPVTSALETLNEDGSRTKLGSFVGAAIGQATGAIDDTNGLVHILGGGLTGPGGASGSVLYQIDTHSLADGSRQASYPLPMVPDPMNPWTGFGQQMGYDAKTNRALVLAPSGAALPGANPYPYKLWAVDLAKNTTSVLRDVGLSTPISEGYPATVDPSRRLFWTILGDASFERKLVAFDVDTGATKVNRTVWQNTSLEVLAYDKKSRRMWGVGNPALPMPGGGMGHLAGPLLLLEMDSDTGEIVATHDTGLGDGWELNTLPGLAAFDAPNGAFICTAARKADGLHPSDPPYVELVRIPVAAPATTTTTKRFCKMGSPSTPGDYNCPKLLVDRYVA